MADFSALRLALETRLKTITPAISTCHTVPDGIEPPFIYVGLPTYPRAPVVLFDQGMGNGSATWETQITLCISRADVGVAQTLLDPYIGNDQSNTQSVYWAIMNDIKLGGTCSSCRVKSAHSYGKHVIGAIDYVGIIFDVEMITSP
jgi:hypothetical protein